MKVPRMYRFVIKWVTPTFIAVIFVASLVKPAGPWGDAFRSLLDGGGWPLAPDSVVGKVLHVGDDGYRWFDESGRVTRALVQDATRALMVCMFAACTAAVWAAWRRRSRRSR